MICVGTEDAVAEGLSHTLPNDLLYALLGEHFVKERVTSTNGVYELSVAITSPTSRFRPPLRHVKLSS